MEHPYRLLISLDPGKSLNCPPRPRRARPGCPKSPRTLVCEILGRPLAAEAVDTDDGTMEAVDADDDTASTDTAQLLGDAAKDQDARNPESTDLDAVRSSGRKSADPTGQSDAELMTPTRLTGRKFADPIVQPSVEYETPVKGPKQVHKLLPRPAGAQPGVQKPPTAEAEDAGDDGDSKEAVDATDSTSWLLTVQQTRWLDGEMRRRGWHSAANRVWGLFRGTNVALCCHGSTGTDSADNEWLRHIAAGQCHS